MLVQLAINVAINFILFYLLTISYVNIFHPLLNVRNHFDTISKG